MPEFGKKSKAKLDTCHPYLQLILNEAIKVYDFAILEGHRGSVKQNNYFDAGKSKLRFPDSKHNKSRLLKRDDVSDAVDIAPWPIDWKDRARFYYLIGIVKGIAFKHGIIIRSGSDWDMDGDFKDQKFDDLPHIELR